MRKVRQAGWPAAGSSATANATLTASPSPTAKVISASQAKALVDAAMLAPNGLALIGGPNKAEETKPTVEQPHHVCTWRRLPRRVLAGHNTKWLVDATVVHQIAVAYESAEAADVVVETRNALGTCKTYDNGTYVVTEVGAVKVPTYPGAHEVLGYCQKITFHKDKRVLVNCEALLTHKGGYLISAVTVYADTRKEAEQQLTFVGAVAAEKLAKLPSSP